jgi:hypothetical protein
MALEEDSQSRGPFFQLKRKIMSFPAVLPPDFDRVLYPTGRVPPPKHRRDDMIHWPLLCKYEGPTPPACVSHGACATAKTPPR